MVQYRRYIEQQTRGIYLLQGALENLYKGYLQGRYIHTYIHTQIIFSIILYGLLDIYGDRIIERDIQERGGYIEEYRTRPGDQGYIQQIYRRYRYIDTGIQEHIGPRPVDQSLWYIQAGNIEHQWEIQKTEDQGRNIQRQGYYIQGYIDIYRDIH